MNWFLMVTIISIKMSEFGNLNNLLNSVTLVSSYSNAGYTGRGPSVSLGDMLTHSLSYTPRKVLQRAAGVCRRCVGVCRGM